MSLIRSSALLAAVLCAPTFAQTTIGFEGFPNTCDDSSTNPNTLALANTPRVTFAPSAAAPGGVIVTDNFFGWSCSMPAPRTGTGQAVFNLAAGTCPQQSIFISDATRDVRLHVNCDQGDGTYAVLFEARRSSTVVANQLLSLDSTLFNGTWVTVNLNSAEVFDEVRISIPQPFQCGNIIPPQPGCRFFIDDIEVGTTTHIYEDGSNLSCSVTPNSSGLPASLVMFGDSAIQFPNGVPTANITTRITGMPPLMLGYPIVSNAFGGNNILIDSCGNLCIGALASGADAPTRWITGNVIQSSASGSVETAFDFSTPPLPVMTNGGLNLLPGTTVYFQYWFRDIFASCNLPSAIAGNNFTNAVAITWQ